MSAQASVVELLRVLGCYVNVRSENRKARGTKGGPDLLVMHPRFSAPACIEHKRKYEPASREQLEFEHHWRMSHGLYLRGGYEEVEAFLRVQGIITVAA